MFFSAGKLYPTFFHVNSPPLVFLGLSKTLVYSPEHIFMHFAEAKEILKVLCVCTKEHYCSGKGLTQVGKS